jgi:hypothetical protein
VGEQEYGCWALRHLALDPECKHIALREGAPQIMRQGMQEYPNRTGVQEQASYALKNLLS